jgi:ubiquinone/menaquinone biosynthesis C-methylase UbiE
MRRNLKDNPSDEAESFAPSVIQAQYDSVAREYDGAYKGVRWEIYDMITWNCIESYLPHENTGGVRILDAGGGTGKWTARIASMGYKVVLLDISEEMLNTAKERLGKLNLLGQTELKKGDITEIPFPDDSFDFILCEGDPLSYSVEKHEVAISNIARVAKEGAIVQIGVDNFFRVLFSQYRNTKDLGLVLGKIEKLLKNRVGFTDPYGLPVYPFTIRELREKLGRAGLEVVQVLGKPVTMCLIPSEEWDKYDADQRLKRELITLEKELMAYEELACLGEHLHVIAKKRQC